MALKFDEYNGVRVLSVEGDLSGDTSAALRRVAEEGIDPGGAPAARANRFVVDLDKCPFIDSDGLESLLALKRRAESDRGRVKLAAPEAHVRKVLEITRLAHRFDCHPDLPSALKAMR